MLSVMAKLIRTELPHVWKLISYQDTEVHNGTIYKASGWFVGGHKTNIGKGWVTLGKGRQRGPMQSSADKKRWEKQIRPEPEMLRPKKTEVSEQQLEMFQRPLPVLAGGEDSQTEKGEDDGR